jgi:hypothetical protein
MSRAAVPPLRREGALGDRRPERLITPGLEGNLHIKWLRRLKFGDQPWLIPKPIGSMVVAP